MCPNCRTAGHWQRHVGCSSRPACRQTLTARLQQLAALENLFRQPPAAYRLLWEDGLGVVDYEPQQGLQPGAAGAGDGQVNCHLGVVGCSTREGRAKVQGLSRQGWAPQKCRRLQARRNASVKQRRVPTVAPAAVASAKLELRLTCAGDRSPVPVHDVRGVIDGDACAIEGKMLRLTTRSPGTVPCHGL